tara:strand:- start:131 stop:706 length:576 start_codon:yes stop_codon:yes gene_type:complete
MSAAIAFHPNTSTAPRREVAAETCPVAALADEAAGLIATLKDLNAEIRKSDLKEGTPFGPIIGEPKTGDTEDEMTAKVVRIELRDRIKAVVQLAAHRRATSAKGAAFQALTMINQLVAMLDVGASDVANEGRHDELENSYHQAERALGSIVGFLDTTAGGLPPHLVGHFLLLPRDQPRAAADRAIRHFTAT